ncbi:MAG TPA: trans-aconitate 2-methyltransferase [Aestuariivirga sp.]
MATWSPTQYLKFADERTRAARDLLAQVPAFEAQVVYDLGCGPGNSTVLLVEAFPKARIVGMDNSPEMLAKAREALPKIEFVEADLGAWQAPPDVDLLFSNATFQWVPKHLEVLQRLLRGLKKGAALAVQMPDNLNEPSHVAMRDAALNAPYTDKLRDAAKARDALPLPRDYYAALKPLCAQFDIWHVIYNHPLDGVAGIVEWVKGTGLRPFLEPLSADEQQDYLARYAILLAKHYPVQADGKVLLRFPRIFMVAVK